MVSPFPLNRLVETDVTADGPANVGCSRSASINSSSLRSGMLDEAGVSYSMAWVR